MKGLERFQTHAICTCHGVDNPQRSWIKVNLRLEREMVSEHISQHGQSGKLLPMQFIVLDCI